MRAAVVLVVACASSFSFLLGYDIGIMSGAKRLIKIDLGLSEGDVELLVGILNLVSGPGGLLSGRLADTMGRRAAAAIACAITLVGALTMAAAQSFAVLLTGRVVTGIGVGCCFHIAPLYIAEVAPKHVRGRLMSFFDLSINVGILAGYLVGWALTPRATRDTAGGAAGAAWRTMLALGAIPPALNLLALLRLPESPRYLVAAGREREAADVLSLVYHPAEASATLDLLRSERRGNKPLNLCAGLRRVLLPARGAPRALIVAGLGCAFWQQATGVEAAVYYTPETLEAAGITDEGDLLLATVGVGLVKVGFIVLAAALVESTGRVTLMLASNAGLCAASLLLGLSFSLGRAVGLALAGQALFMAAFSLGVGPCAMMAASELFPLQVRGFALGVATLINRTTSGLVAVSFLSLTRALTPAGAYYLFAALAAAAFAFTRRYVPETKGRSLEEIEQHVAAQHRASSGGLARLDAAAAADGDADVAVQPAVVVEMGAGSGGSGSGGGVYGRGALRRDAEAGHGQT